jgi:hypothetical protein
MSTALRSGTHLVAGIGVLGALALGLMWLRDRTHRWEIPTWRAGAFVQLRAAAGPADLATARWVMAVNPRCPHCMSSLATVHALWSRRRWPCPLIALIVDTPHPPGVEEVGAFPPVEVWWDRAGIWRRRWGHRLYGELIQFDAGGQMVQAVPPGDVMRRPHCRAEPLAPGNRNEGGT